MTKREMVIISKDSNGNTNRTKINFEINPDSTVTFQMLDQAARKLLALSTDTYSDVEIIQTYSLTEELGG